MGNIALVLVDFHWLYNISEELNWMVAKTETCSCNWGISPRYCIYGTIKRLRTIEMKWFIININLKIFPFGNYSLYRANSSRNGTIKIDDWCHTIVMGSIKNISTIPFFFLSLFRLWCNSFISTGYECPIERNILHLIKMKTQWRQRQVKKTT